MILSMNVFKDLMRLLALALIIRAVWSDSVACAICAGTLYMGGFDSTLHLSRLVGGDRKQSRRETPDNVISLKHFRR